VHRINKALNKLSQLNVGFSRTRQIVSCLSETNFRALLTEALSEDTGESIFVKGEIPLFYSAAPPTRKGTTLQLIRLG
jgi:hypothetical protein